MYQLLQPEVQTVVDSFSGQLGAERLLDLGAHVDRRERAALHRAIASSA